MSAAALGGAGHFWEMCLINSRRQREQSPAPRSTVCPSRAASWRKRGQLKPAVPQVTGRCRDLGMCLLLLLALPASGGISQFSLIHLEITVHSFAPRHPQAADRPVAQTVEMCCKDEASWPPSFGLDVPLVDAEWFPCRFLAEGDLAGYWNSSLPDGTLGNQFTTGSVPVYSEWEKYSVKWKSDMKLFVWYLDFRRNSAIKWIHVRLRRSHAPTSLTVLPANYSGRSAPHNPTYLHGHM